MDKKRVIIVTDGDFSARKAVERATINIGGRCISRSAGNPTPINGSKIVDLIKEAKHDPVVVMVDDKGHQRMGKGEEALDKILVHPDIEILGVIAVASNTQFVNGVKVDVSITNEGEVIEGAVDKEGLQTNKKILYGDTVDVLGESKVPFIIGIGDIGKMHGKDNCEIGAPIITKALEEIINRSETNEKTLQKTRRKH